MTDTELTALLRLRCVPGMGDVNLGRLLERCGSAEALLSLPLELLAKAGAEQPEERDSARTLRRVAQILRVLERLEVSVFALHQPDYPPRLRSLEVPPVLLFARGRLSLLSQRSVAVVGTRHPTDYGLSVTEQLVSGLARANIAILSGGALGIDATAHRTALAEGGATTAVLGCGIDVVYPRGHEQLFEQIAETGLLLSEFLPGDPPMAHHFPRRNRIIARLAHAVLVVEAGPSSGALITAEQASDAVTVMAVPGPVGRLTSPGPNRLIQDGAKLVVDVNDVLEELGGPLHAQAAEPRRSARPHWRAVERPVLAESTEERAARRGRLSPAVDEILRMQQEVAPLLAPAHQAIYLALAPEPVHLDVLARQAGMDAASALDALLELELAGHALGLGGKRYRLPPPTRKAEKAAQPQD